MERYETGAMLVTSRPNLFLLACFVGVDAAQSLEFSGCQAVHDCGLAFASVGFDETHRLQRSVPNLGRDKVRCCVAHGGNILPLQQANVNLNLPGGA